MANDKKLIAIISGAEAMTVEGLVAMFTAIKGRPPTDQELAEFEAKAHRLKPPDAAPAPAQRQILPTARGRRGPADGRGFGIVGGTVSPPKKSISKSIQQALNHRRNIEQLDAELPDAFRRDNGWIDRTKH